MELPSASRSGDSSSQARHQARPYSRRVINWSNLLVAFITLCLSLLVFGLNPFFNVTSNEKGLIPRIGTLNLTSLLPEVLVDAVRHQSGPTSGPTAFTVFLTSNHPFGLTNSLQTLAGLFSAPLGFTARSAAGLDLFSNSLLSTNSSLLSDVVRSLLDCYRLPGRNQYCKSSHLGLQTENSVFHVLHIGPPGSGVLPLISRLYAVATASFASRPMTVAALTTGERHSVELFTHQMRKSGVFTPGIPAASHLPCTPLYSSHPVNPFAADQSGLYCTCDSLLSSCSYGQHGHYFSRKMVSTVVVSPDSLGFTTPTPTSASLTAAHEGRRDTRTTRFDLVWLDATGIEGVLACAHYMRSVQAMAETDLPSNLLISLVSFSAAELKLRSVMRHRGYRLVFYQGFCHQSSEEESGAIDTDSLRRRRRTPSPDWWAGRQPHCVLLLTNLPVEVVTHGIFGETNTSTETVVEGHERFFNFTDRDRNAQGEGNTPVVDPVASTEPADSSRVCTRRTCSDTSSTRNNGRIWSGSWSWSTVLPLLMLAVPLIMCGFLLKGLLKPGRSSTAGSVAPPPGFSALPSAV